jgi:outer membrane biogenesis lipoprotein LolB
MFEKSGRMFLQGLGVVLLAACSQATPYQPASSGSAIHGGDSQQLIAPNHYRVRFHGNSLTSRETVEAYLLYRAA